MMLVARMAGQEEVTLAALFDTCLKLREEVENSTLPTNSDKLQVKIKEGIDELIKTTVLVSELGVFSSNETLDELPTSSIKFLLLPVLLGYFSEKRTDIDRLEVLRIANVYYKDFIMRCKQYELTDASLPEDQIEEADHNDALPEEKIVHKASTKRGMPTPKELEVMARQREEKLRRYKEKKAVADRLAELKKALDNPGHDEDTLRNYYITMVKKFVHESLDELQSVIMEHKMLSEMEVMKKKGMLPSSEVATKTTPFKPILITRDAINKNVFGMGYPSHPSMSVAEFYDQRVKDGWFPDPSKRLNCLQDQAELGPEVAKEAEEHEEEEKEKAEEQDDPEKLAQDRKWDEWRDTHRRGWGNTYNRS
ncbi:immunoglobulin-binding protein 1 [Cherax quadricarinatus]